MVWIARWRRAVTGTPIYYEAQTNWSPADFYALWRYMDRLFQYIGPTKSLQAALDHPESLSERDKTRVARVAALQAKRTGKRDDELASLDLSRMSEDTRYLMKHMLIQSERLELAVERFPNLRGLLDVGELGHDLYLDAHPRGTYEYFTKVGIHL